MEFTEPLLDALDIRACFAVVCAQAPAGPPESKSVTVGRAVASWVSRPAQLLELLQVAR